jgi:hypothetical protein
VVEWEGRSIDLQRPIERLHRAPQAAFDLLPQHLRRAEDTEKVRRQSGLSGRLECFPRSHQALPHGGYPTGSHNGESTQEEDRQEQAREALVHRRRFFSALQKRLRQQLGVSAARLQPPFLRVFLLYSRVQRSQNAVRVSEDAVRRQVVCPIDAGQHLFGASATRSPSRTTWLFMVSPPHRADINSPRSSLFSVDRHITA